MNCIREHGHWHFWGLCHTWQTSVLEAQGQSQWKKTKNAHWPLQSHKHPPAHPLVMTRWVMYSTGTWHFFSDALRYAFNAWRASLPSLTYKLWKVAIQTFSVFSEPPLEHGWFYIYSVSGTGTRPIHTISHLKTERQKRPPILLPF